MKLSDIQSTDRFLDIICEVTPFVEQIIKDEEINALLKDKLKATNGEISKEEIMSMAMDKGLEKVVKFIPVLLKKNRNAIYGILSSVNEKSVGEIAIQHPKETILQVKELLTDKEFISLFL